MNLHQKLKSIEAKRDRERRYPASKNADKWEKPFVGKVTKRRNLCPNTEPKEKMAPLDRGSLEIGPIDREGGYDSLVHCSISSQMQRFEKLIDTRTSEIKTELVSK